jgi:hypothetical protein
MPDLVLIAVLHMKVAAGLAAVLVVDVSIDLDLMVV